MDTPKNELRQRLRELLSVPERERTDPQWDEIIELEIRLAPGNQIDSNRNGDPVPNGQNFRPRPPNKGHQNPRKQGRRPNKGYPPRSGGGGSGGGNTPPQSTPQ
ncbi:conserved protein of unknown function [Georgfuchsia toluolica]|uniref:Uncharacterized protein n=1 Tax=Georgfuchsia toluolica TaxID=424218 RepID=A0A916J5X4_9PROT|nr:hypothetical protein [Georgfuchsia toluolica]CAG4883770.1 conserved protein of unknown function [Georgfuchsia toluolica]